MRSFRMAQSLTQTAGETVARGAEIIAATIRDVVEALHSPDGRARIALVQIRAARGELADLEREIQQRVSAGRDATDLVRRAGLVLRAVRGHGEGDVQIAAYLAHCLDAAAHLVCGDVPAEKNEAGHLQEIDLDHVSRKRLEATRAGMRVRGVRDAALSRFAVVYPDVAAKLNDQAMERLVTAWTAGVQGGKWPALDAVWKDTFRRSFGKNSVKNYMTKHYANVENYPST